MEKVPINIDRHPKDSMILILFDTPIVYIIAPPNATANEQAYRKSKELLTTVTFSVSAKCCRNCFLPQPKPIIIISAKNTAIPLII
jgi:hypothetical protein